LTITVVGIMITSMVRFIRRWIALSAVLLVSTLALDAQVSGALVEYVEGPVWIDRAGSRLRAQFGDELSPRDTVTTGPDGVAILRLNDESVVKLRSDTMISLATLKRPARVRLERGGVFARVAKRAAASVGRSAFEVTTPTVVAGVRGTEFFVAFGRTIEDRPDVWLCVNEGEVEVSVPETGAAAVVREGEGINILAGTRVTDPQFYDWTTKLNFNFDAESGEVGDDTNLDAAYSDLLDQDYD
jgi:hypothetical protein